MPAPQKTRGSDSGLSVLVVAGEASSDEHAAELVQNLLKIDPTLRVFGMGGRKLRAAGMETIIDIETSAAVMGLTEVIGSLGKIFRARRALLQAVAERKPALVILVDFPDFNLWLARGLRGSGARVLYFISPQLWAWRSGRVKQIKRDVSQVATIFPFEVDFYHRHGVRADFVGHPYLDRPPLNIKREEFRRSVGLDPQAKTIALLPGSRRAEIARLLPVMLDAFRLLRQQMPELQAILPVAPILERGLVEDLVQGEAGVTLVQGQVREALFVADAAVVASGTATVEAALSQTPFIVVYKLSTLTYLVGRLLVRGVKFFAMPNLIAGKLVVPELLQSEVTADRLVSELERLLADQTTRRRIESELAIVRERLRGGLADGSSAGERAARIAQRLLGESEVADAATSDPRSLVRAV